MMTSAPGPVIALYGGSFDPPHVAHVLAAAWLLSAAGVDAVWVMPVCRHPFGKELAPWSDRLTMCQRAFAFLGSRCEVRQDEHALAVEPSYTGRTLDLLRALRTGHPGHRFRLVVGSDALAERDHWHAFDAIAAMAPPIVLGRPGHPTGLTEQPAIVLPDVSSTALRADLAAGRDTTGRLPTAVAEWIAARGLYHVAAVPEVTSAVASARPRAAKS